MIMDPKLVMALSLAPFVSDDDASLDRYTFLRYVRDRIQMDLDARVMGMANVFLSYEVAMSYDGNYSPRWPSLQGTYDTAYETAKAVASSEIVTLNRQDRVDD